MLMTKHSKTILQGNDVFFAGGHMGIAQLSKQIGKSVEHELTLIFATMGDSYLPEESHTHIPTSDYNPAPQQGMDASGYAPHFAAPHDKNTQPH